MAGKTDNWFKDLFINEVKAALDSRNNMSGSGGNTEEIDDLLDEINGEVIGEVPIETEEEEQI